MTDNKVAQSTGNLNQINPSGALACVYLMIYSCLLLSHTKWLLHWL